MSAGLLLAVIAGSFVLGSLAVVTWAQAVVRSERQQLAFQRRLDERRLQRLAHVAMARMLAEARRSR